MFSLSLSLELLEKSCQVKNGSGNGVKVSSSVELFFFFICQFFFDYFVSFLIFFICVIITYLFYLQ
jgi:hypothetical protein